MADRADEPVPRQPCPYHSTLANGMRLFPASHPCLTVYDEPRTLPAGGESDG